MSNFETEIGRPSEDPATRAKASAYLTRTGNADLLPILGLAVETPKARGTCPVCNRQVHSHGGCNRSKACREATHGGDVIW